MQILRLPLSKIDIGQRLRAVNPERAAELAVSLREVGQITAIEVMPADARGMHRLVAGAHRVEATRIAGGTTINATVFGGEAEMDPDRLKYEALPEGNGGDPGELFGLKQANPKRTTPSTFISPATNTGPTGDQAAGYDEGSMRPRNRTLVQRYFDSK